MNTVMPLTCFVCSYSEIPEYGVHEQGLNNPLQTSWDWMKFRNDALILFSMGRSILLLNTHQIFSHIAVKWLGGDIQYAS